MKPVYQKRAIECMRACFASILELPYDAVPFIDPVTLTENEFFERWRAFAQAHGYTLLWVGTDILKEWGVLNRLPGYSVGLGRDANNQEHAVVCKDGAIEFDPYLGAAPLKEIHAFGLFIATDPRGKL